MNLKKMQKRQKLGLGKVLMMVLVSLMLLGTGIRAEEAGPPEGYKTEDYYPTKEDIAYLTQETLQWDRSELIVKMLQYEYMMDTDAFRIINLEDAVIMWKRSSKLHTEQLEDVKKLYRLKTAKGVLIGGSVGVGVTLVAVILVRLAVAGRL